MDREWLLQELLSFLSYLQQAIFFNIFAHHAFQHHLAYKRVPEVGVHLHDQPSPERLQLVVAESIDLRIGLAKDDIDYVIDAKTFVQLVDGIQRTIFDAVLTSSFSLGLTQLSQLAAVVLFYILRQSSAAAVCDGKHRFLHRQRFRYQLCTHFAFAQRLVAHQVFQLLYVFVRVVQKAFAFHPSRPARPVSW
jgi:hypothetical protein